MPEEKFDFQKGYDWFSLKYLHVLSERILLFFLCIISISLFCFILINIINFFPIKNNFSIVSNNDNSLDNIAKIYHLTSDKNDHLSNENIVLEYLINHYVKCHENLESINSSNNLCFMYLSHYTDFNNFLNIKNKIEANLINQMYNEKRKVIEIENIILYKTNVKQHKIVSDFLVNGKAFYLINNKFDSYENFQINLTAEISKLDLILKKIVDIGFIITDYRNNIT